MDYHHRQLFNEKYRPKGFCHAIRRPQHYPEGTLSLESRNEKGDYRPVPCLVASRSTMGDETSAPPISFPLNAASNLTVSLIQSAIYKCDTLLIFSISFRYDYSSPVSVVSVSPFIYLHLPKFIFFFDVIYFLNFFFNFTHYCSNIYFPFFFPFFFFIQHSFTETNICIRLECINFKMADRHPCVWQPVLVNSVHSF
jgi:hypothetical protein